MISVAASCPFTNEQTNMEIGNCPLRSSVCVHVGVHVEVRGINLLPLM